MGTCKGSRQGPNDSPSRDRVGTVVGIEVGTALRSGPHSASTSTFPSIKATRSPRQFTGFRPAWAAKSRTLFTNTVSASDVNRPLIV